MADPFVELAEETRQQPEVLRGLTSWFDSQEPRSAFHFGWALGTSDQEGEVAPVIAGWVEEGRCGQAACGYLAGLAQRAGGLPAEWGERLDQIAGRHPEYTALLTLQADTTQQGFVRIVRVVRSGKLPRQQLLGFNRPPWPNVLGNTDKVEILQVLLDAPPGGPHPTPLTAGIILLANWSEYGKKEMAGPLREPALQFLRRSLQGRTDSGAWPAVVRALAAPHPVETTEIILEALTSPWESRVAVEDEVVPILKGIASQHPELVMAALGQRFLDSGKRPWLQLMSLPGVLEAIGLPHVQRWATSQGSEALRALAFHLDSPHIKEGRPFVPPVTEWVLAHFEGDDEVFQAFCSGRHTIEILVGNARDRRAELEAAVGPFLHHPLRRIREWAQYELKLNDRQAAWDDLDDERSERR
jgi:hypothetical protein